MAGGAGVEWYFGYDYPHNDLNCEDFRSRDHLWDLTRYAVEFFHRYLPFTDMSPYDELTSAEESRCLALPHKVYAIYLPNGGTTTLDLQQHSGTLIVQWFNPRQGAPLLDGSVITIKGPGPQPIGLPPSDHEKDWLAIIRFDTSPLKSQIP
ncbi:MAG: putative collagen-binding domain-containing protein [Planctomycetota bacterium]|jgi:hypothetical protein